MDSPQTLHDFVLNLLSNPDARMAFQVDPEGALHDAGLSDVNAQDVQEAIPLVVDYSPAANVTGLETSFTDLTGDVLRADPSAAVAHLQLIAQQLPLTQSVNEFSLAASGALAGDADGLSGTASVSGTVPTGLGGLSVGGSPGFSSSHDVTHLLDSTPVLAGLAPAATGVLADPTGLLGGAGGLLGGADGLLGGAGGLLGTPTGALGDVTNLLHDPVGALGGLLGQDPTGALGGTPGDPTGALTHDPTGTVGGATQGVTAGAGNLLDGHALDSSGLGGLTGGVTDHGLDLGGLTSGVTDHGLDVGGLTGGLTDGLTGGGPGGGVTSGGSVSTTPDSTHATLHGSGVLDHSGVGDVLGQVTQVGDAAGLTDDGHLLGIPLF